MSSNVNQAIARLSKQTNLPMEAFRDAIIEEMCQITDSTIAYFYALNPSEDGLTLLGYSKSVMASCSLEIKKDVYRIESIGLWGDAIRERCPIITNDYENSDRPSKHGLPEGHVAVHSHMNLPVIVDGHIVCLVGVGNKAAPYTVEDTENLEALMHAIWADFQEALWEAVF